MVLIRSTNPLHPTVSTTYIYCKQWQYNMHNANSNFEKFLLGKLAFPKRIYLMYISFRDQRHPQNTSKNHIMQVSHEILFFVFQQNLQKIHIEEEKKYDENITVEKSLILQIIRRIAEKFMIKVKIHKNAS